MTSSPGLQLRCQSLECGRGWGPSKEELIALAQVSLCRPGLQILPAQRLNVATVQMLRATVNAIPAAPSVAQGEAGSSTTCAAAGTQGQQAALVLSDEGRRLLLQHLLR